MNPLSWTLDAWAESGPIGVMRQGVALSRSGLGIAKASLRPVKSYGCRFDVRSSRIGLRERLWVLKETYEQDEIELIRRYLPSDTAVIELGGGIGVVSCVIDSHLDATTQHVVVEANPELIPLLERQRYLNDATFRIEPAAYAPSASEARLEQNDSLLRTTVNGNGIPINTISLIDIIEKGGFTTFSVVADIEGAEIKLLESELSILKRYCPQLILEVHPRLGLASKAIEHINKSPFEIQERQGNVLAIRNLNETTKR